MYILNTTFPPEEFAVFTKDDRVRSQKVGGGSNYKEVEKPGEYCGCFPELQRQKLKFEAAETLA